MRRILIGAAFGWVTCMGATGWAQDITWSPAKIQLTAFTGSTRMVTVSFTTNADVSDASARIVPALAPYVTTSQTELGDLHAGDTVSLLLFITIPEGAPNRAVGGTLHVLAEKGRTVARPLQISLTIKAPGPPVQWVGPDGGVLGFPGGVVFDIPPGAVSTPVRLQIDPLPAGDLLDAVLKQPRFSSHRARVLGGFAGGPDGLEFQSPVRVSVPVSPLDASEIPMLGTIALSSETSEIVATNLLYLGRVPAVEMELTHFSDRVVLGLSTPDQHDPGDCAEGPAGDACREMREIELLCTNPATFTDPRCEDSDPLQPACCLLYPGDRPGDCACCRESLVKVTASSVDFSAGSCQILSDTVVVEFPVCGVEVNGVWVAPPPEEHQLEGQSKECPRDMQFSVSVQPAALTLAVCMSATLSAKITGVSADGRTVLAPATVDPVWESTDGGLVSVDNRSGAVCGLKQSAGPVNVLAWVQHDPEILGAAQVTVIEPEVTIVTSDGSSPGLLRLRPGDSAQLEARLSIPYGMALHQWSIADPAVATIDGSTGMITGSAIGGLTTVTVAVTYGAAEGGECTNTGYATLMVSVAPLAVRVPAFELNYTIQDTMHVTGHDIDYVYSCSRLRRMTFGGLPYPGSVFPELGVIVAYYVVHLIESCFDGDPVELEFRETLRAPLGGEPQAYNDHSSISFTGTVVGNMMTVEVAKSGGTFNYSYSSTVSDGRPVSVYVTRTVTPAAALFFIWW